MARRVIPNVLVLAVLIASPAVVADPGTWEPVTPNAPAAQPTATPPEAKVAPAPVPHATDVAATTAAADAAPVPSAAPEPAKPAQAAAAPKAPVVAIVVSVKGIAEQRQTSAPQSKWQPLKVKDTLTMFTLIRTGMGSRVVIHVRDRVRLTIRAGTKVGVGQVVGPRGGLVKMRLDLKSGSIRTQIDRTRGANDVRVSTPDAALAVTGSDADINFGNRTDFKVRESTWKFTVADLLVLVQPGQSRSTSNTPQSRTEFFGRAVMPVFDQRGTEFGYGGVDGRERNPLQYVGNPGDRWAQWNGPSFGGSHLPLLNCFGTGQSNRSVSPIDGYDSEYSPGFDGKFTDGESIYSYDSILTGLEFTHSGYQCVRQFRMSN